MLNEIIIAGGTLVLSIVGVLILLELRRGRLAQQSFRGTGHPPVANEAVEEDVTLLARRPRLPVIEEAPESVEEATPSTAAMLFEDGAEIDEPTGSKRMFVVWAAGQTDVGKARKRNEDSILMLGEYSLFVVADGMGGYAGGDVASKLACQAIERSFRSGQFAGTSEPGVERPLKGNELVWALEAANDAIRSEARAHSEYGRMGATVIGARFVERKQRAYIGHVGDSRCYRYRRGELRLLTTDHTMAAKGVPGPMGHHVRRALGVAPEVHVDLLVDRPHLQDVYVLCSDGLNKMLDDARIAQILEAHIGDLDAAVRELIDQANRSGGKDNVSVILVGIRPNASEVVA